MPYMCQQRIAQSSMGYALPVLTGGGRGGHPALLTTFCPPHLPILLHPTGSSTLNTWCHLSTLVAHLSQQALLFSLPIWLPFPANSDWGNLPYTHLVLMQALLPLPLLSPCMKCLSYLLCSQLWVHWRPTVRGLLAYIKKKGEIK